MNNYNIIVKAIKNKNKLSFDFKGKNIIFNPHLYGLTFRGNEAIYGYENYSKTWNYYTVDVISNLKKSKNSFRKNKNYIENSKYMLIVYESIK